MLYGGCRMTVSEREQVPLLTLENDTIRVGICAGKGAHLYEWTDKWTGTEFLYQDPKGPLHYDVGGWYELFPNAGKACLYNGISVPKHGDVQHRPWTYEIAVHTPERIVLRLQTESGVLPYRLEKTVEIRRDRPCLFISEKVTNIGTDPQPYLWGHHVTFGGSFVDEHCRIDLPSCRVYKRPEYNPAASRLIPEAAGTLRDMPGKDGGRIDMSQFPAVPCSEMVFIDQLGGHWYSVYNEKRQVGIGLCWDGGAFPYLWLWQENFAEKTSPFHGNVRGLALEPQRSNVPILEQAVAAGEAPFLQPGESAEAWLTAVIHTIESPIAGVTQEGELLR